MNAILMMSSFIFPLITFSYVSRILLPIGTGKVSFVTSFISYFLMISQLGIPTYGIRACAVVRDNKTELTRTAHELFAINILMSIVAYFFLFLALLFIPRLREERILYLVVSLTILFNAIGMEWLFKALEQYTYITVRSIIFKIIALIAVFLLIHKQEDYVIFGAISIFAASASNIFNFYHAHCFIGMHRIGDYHLKRHLKPVMIFFAMACATTIYTHIDTVMLGFMKTDEDVGYYNAAVKIKAILVCIVTSLGAVLLPRLSYYVQEGRKEEYEKIICKAFQFVLLVSIPLAVYFSIFAKQGIFFLSGDKYAGSILPMQIIMPTLVLIGLSNITGIQILVPSGMERFVLYSELAGAAVNLLFNAILIPRYASVGAAIGTLAAEAVVILYQSCVLRDKLSKIVKSFHFWKYIVAAALGAVTSFWVSCLELGTFTTLVLSAALFFGTYGIVMLLAKDPFVLDLYKQAFSKLRDVI